MSGCELCGRITFLVKAEIEGVVMSACNICAKHGKILLHQSPSKPKFKKKKKIVAAEPEEIEQVRADFAEVLRGERNKKHMNQADFADLLHIKQSTLIHFESGSHKPGIIAAKKIGRILGVEFIEMVSTKSEFEIPKQSSGAMTIGDIIKFKKK